jgi:hypothetical protein
MAEINTIKQLNEKLVVDYRRLALQAFNHRLKSNNEVNLPKAESTELVMQYINELRRAMGEPEIETKVELEGNQPVLYEKTGWRKANV